MTFIAPPPGVASKQALTAHPLQRVGAYALAVLAGADSPEAMTGGQFAEAVEIMTDDCVATADLGDAKAPGAFWLKASYQLWPNSAMNHNIRAKLSREDRRSRIRAWRTYPAPEIGAPCALCGRPACGYYGKLDIPLGASTEHRNTTAPDHEGLPLCAGCVACFHALPYGCMFAGVQFTALHSWDNQFLARTTAIQAGRTQRLIAVAGGPAAKPGPYAREVAALRRLRAYGETLRAGVELFVFRNGNQDQSLEVHELAQPLAEWLRATMRDPAAAEGFRWLVRAHHRPQRGSQSAHHTAKVPGHAWLARNVFRQPDSIPGRAAGYLAGRAADGPPAGTAALAGICLDYAQEVLGVKENDVTRIRELAARLGGRIAAEPAAGNLKRFQQAHRDPRALQSYLKRAAVDWALRSGEKEALCTDQQWRLLFDPDSQSYLARDLLFIAVLENLAGRGWQPVPGKDDDMDDDDDLPGDPFTDDNDNDEREVLL